VGELDPGADLTSVISRVGLLLDAAGLLGIGLDLWRVQNRLLDVYTQLSDSGDLGGPLREAFARLADRLCVNRGLLGWRP
jgi:hypothetical protein